MNVDGDGEAIIKGLGTLPLFFFTFLRSWDKSLEPVAQLLKAFYLPPNVFMSTPLKERASVASEGRHHRRQFNVEPRHPQREGHIASSGETYTITE